MSKYKRKYKYQTIEKVVVEHEGEKDIRYYWEDDPVTGELVRHKRTPKELKEYIASLEKADKAAKAALKYGYKSGLERKISEQIRDAGNEVRYETMKIEYCRPMSKYTPDFVLDNGIIIETKGRFVGADRAKHLYIKKQHPGKYDIRFVFNNPNARLTKASKTTYGKWCEKHGFKYSAKSIPKEWFDE